MKSLVLFGRKVPTSSTMRRTIPREFTSLFAEEHAREMCAEAEGLLSSATWDEICQHRALTIAGGSPAASHAKKV